MCVPTTPGGATYTPFTEPTGTAYIVFNFGLTNGNDGPDKIFAIPQILNCTIPGSCDPDLGEVPEPASLTMLGSGLVLLVGSARRRFKK